MNSLRLVNPQPMETLPEDGNPNAQIFYQVLYENGENRVFFDYLYRVRFYVENPIDVDTYPAWSYTATFEPVKGGNNGLA